MIVHDGAEVGYLDAEQYRGCVYVAMLLFPAARGAGLAEQVVAAALTQPLFRVGRPVVAAIELDNEAARPVAAPAGFEPMGTCRRRIHDLPLQPPED